MRWSRIFALILLLAACGKPAPQEAVPTPVAPLAVPTRIRFASEGDLEPALASWAQQHLRAQSSFKIVRVRLLPRDFTVLVEAEARSANRCSRELHGLFIVNDDDGNARVADESLYAEDCCTLEAACLERTSRGWMYYFARQQELGNDDALRRLVDPERGVILAEFQCLGDCTKEEQPRTIRREEFGVALLGSSWGVEIQSLKFVSCEPGRWHAGNFSTGAGAWSCGDYNWQKSRGGAFLTEINHQNLYGLRPGVY